MSSFLIQTVAREQCLNLVDSQLEYVVHFTLEYNQIFAVARAT